MSKIFGEEHFIDNTMVEIVEAYNNQLDHLVFDKMTQTIKYKMPDIVVDEQKVRDWVVLCMKLENIDKSDLIDIAVKKKFADKDEELAIYKRALELACFRLLYGIRNDDIYYRRKQELEMIFLDQAKKELEEQE